MQQFKIQPTLCYKVLCICCFVNFSLIVSAIDSEQDFLIINNYIGFYNNLDFIEQNYQ